MSPKRSIKKRRNARSEKGKEDAERRKRQRLAAIAKAKVDALLDGARAWHEAVILRNYINAVECAAGAQNEQFAAWARWASLEVDKLDPISSGRAMTALREVEERI